MTKIQQVLRFVQEKCEQGEGTLAKLENKQGLLEVVLDRKAGFKPLEGESWMCELGEVLVRDSVKRLERITCFPLYKVREWVEVEFTMERVGSNRELQGATFDGDGNKILWKPVAASAMFQPQPGESWECLSGRIVARIHNARGTLVIRECQPVKRLTVPHVTVGKQDAPLVSLTELVAPSAKPTNGHKPERREPTPREKRRQGNGFDPERLRGPSEQVLAAVGN